MSVTGEGLYMGAYTSTAILRQEGINLERNVGHSMRQIKVRQVSPLPKIANIYHVLNRGTKPPPKTDNLLLCGCESYLLLTDA